MQWRGRGNRRQQPMGPKRQLALRVLRMFRPYRWAAALLVVLIGVTAWLELVPVLLIKRIVDALETDGSANEKLARLDGLFVLLVSAILAGGLLGVAIGFLNQTIG